MRTLLFVIILLLIGCQKNEVQDVAPKTKVQYVIETGHGYTWYNIENTEYYHPVHTIFDTTFHTYPGWEVTIHALTTTGSMRVLLIVNDVILASEQTYTGQNITISRTI